MDVGHRERPSMGIRRTVMPRRIRFLYLLLHYLVETVLAGGEAVRVSVSIPWHYNCGQDAHEIISQETLPDIPGLW